MPNPLPSSAACRGCRYPLRNLETNICPECGQGFDPGDSSTFIDNPRLHKRRRILRWTLILLILGVLIFIFCPRGIRRGTITYNFSDGTSFTVTRSQPVAVSWLPIQWPAIHHENGTPLEIPHTIGLRYRRHDGGGGGMTIGIPTHQQRVIPLMNGIPVHPENARQILESVFETNRLMTSSMPKTDDSPDRRSSDE